MQRGSTLYEWALYWPALLLVVLYILSSFWMQRVMRRVSEPDPELKAMLEAADKKKKKPDQKKGPDLGEQMQRNMRFMTIFLVLIAFILSTGALLYFFMQNLLMIVEYTFIPRTMKLGFSTADVKEALTAIDKGRSITGEEPPAEEVAQAPLRARQSRGFKKKK
jgi:membrane protein insertase Oxa1/YidC/SpoIIIJ